MSALKVTIVTLMIALIGVVLWKVLASPTPKNQVPPIVSKNSVARLTPQPSTVKISKLTGQVVSVSGNNLVLSVKGQNQTVSLVGALSFQKVVSGSIESGNANLAQAKITDLQAGQTLLITFDQTTGQTRTIFITK